MKALILSLALALSLTACGSSGGSAAQAKVADPSIPAVTSPTDPTTPVVVGSDPILVVYTQSLVKTVTTGSASGSVTVTGYCAVYNGGTYCWDDGWHRAIPSSAISFWGFVEQNGVMLQGSEGAAGVGDAVDPMLNIPTLMTTAIVNELGDNTIEGDGTESTRVTRLLAAGTQTQVHCTVDAQSNLDCGTFTLVVQ